MKWFHCATVSPLGDMANCRVTANLQNLGVCCKITISENYWLYNDNDD